MLAVNIDGREVALSDYEAYVLAWQKGLMPKEDAIEVEG